MGGECEECRKNRLQRKAEDRSSQFRTRSPVPKIVHEVLDSQGQPLDPGTRAFMELRLGHDFSRVSVHTDAKAAESARSVEALAYTVGNNLVFDTGQYTPNTVEGRKLIAHELAHVIQQTRLESPSNATEIMSDSCVEERAANQAAERAISNRHAGSVENAMVQQRTVPDSQLQRQRGGAAAAASACAIPSECPSDFCTPFSSVFAATVQRDAEAPILLAGIAAKVSPRVVGLWNQYLFGGSAPQNLSGRFGADFTSSATTADATDFLVDALTTSVESNPPSFPVGTNTAIIDIPTRIPSQIAELGDPGSANQMDFNVIGEIPGNIAGGIGKDQLSCSVGARPSPFNDDRTASGTASVTQEADNSLTVVPSITFTVRDTIDLCPGNCGATIEQIATVPMSRFEATGISGDVPFTVVFPAPPRSFSVPASSLGVGP